MAIKKFILFNLIVTFKLIACSVDDDVDVALRKLIKDVVSEELGNYDKQIDEKLQVIYNLTKVVDSLKGEASLLQKEQEDISKMTKIIAENTKGLQDSTNKIENRLIGVEHSFTTSFKVMGDHHFYYPVAIAVHDQSLIRSPLEYVIHRTYLEEAPDSLRPVGDSDGNRHYPALSFKFWATQGGWNAGGNSLKVIHHEWEYNKTVANIELGTNWDSRVIVWLRGGGILYHIKSPVDLTGKYFGVGYTPDSIKAYYEDNDVLFPAVVVSGTTYPANHVNPIAFHEENQNLMKQGQYDGWAF